MALPREHSRRITTGHQRAHTYVARIKCVLQITHMHNADNYGFSCNVAGERLDRNLVAVLFS